MGSLEIGVLKFKLYASTLYIVDSALMNNFSKKNFTQYIFCQANLMQLQVLLLLREIIIVYILGVKKKCKVTAGTA